MKIISFTLIGLFIMVCAAFSSSVAGIVPGLTDVRFVVGGSQTLQPGRVVDGTLVVLFGQLAVEPDAVVQGDLIAFSSDVSIRGAIQGEILSLESDVNLHAFASRSQTFRKLDLLHVILQLPQIHSVDGLEQQL